MSSWSITWTAERTTSTPSEAFNASSRSSRADWDRAIVCFSFVEFLGRYSRSLTRWPLKLQETGPESHHPTGRDLGGLGGGQDSRPVSDLWTVSIIVARGMTWFGSGQAEHPLWAARLRARSSTASATRGALIVWRAAAAARTYARSLMVDG